MKKCPGCEQSVEASDRKCSSCGRGLDTRPAAWPGLVGAIGGVLVGLGAALLLLVAFSPTMLSLTLALIIGATLALGGLLLGVGWIGFWLAGRADFFVIAGSLALPAAIITAVLLPGGAGMILAKGAIGLGGMLLCAAAHVFALRDSAFASMGLARVAAGTAAVGLFVHVSAFAKQIALPVAVSYVLGVLTFGGLALLGFALAARLPRIRA